MINANEELKVLNQEVIERIKSAVSSGVKIQAIASKSNITYFRIASVVNTNAYRYSTSFNEQEVSRINNALNAIGGAFYSPVG